jgi:hypothetical protein
VENSFSNAMDQTERFWPFLMDRTLKSWRTWKLCGGMLRKMRKAGTSTSMLPREEDAGW